MIQAVIFDYGNVLSLPQDQDAMPGLARAAGIEPGLMRQLYWKNRLAFDRMDLYPEAYWQAIAREAGTSFDDAKMSELTRLDNESWSRPNELMVRWANRLRTHGCRIGVLSNMPITLRRHLTENAQWLRGFDHYTFSCDVNLVKPEPAIYRHALQGVGVAAGEALFLDDREENVEGARKAGLNAALFVSPEQLNRDLNFGLPGIFPQ